MKPDVKYGRVHPGALHTTVYGCFLLVATLSVKLRATVASFTKSPPLPHFFLPRGDCSSSCIALAYFVERGGEHAAGIVTPFFVHALY
jgi:hypothetical protein